MRNTWKVMNKCKKYAVCKMETCGCRAGVAYKTEEGPNTNGIVKVIKFPDYVRHVDFEVGEKTMEYYDDEEEAVRSLDEWAGIGVKCTAFKLEKAISKKRMGFVYCGDVWSYSRVIANYLDRIGEAPTVLRKDYVNIKDIEEYDNKEEAGRSLNDFLNGNESE